jgi:hypothetical protein
MPVDLLTRYRPCYDVFALNELIHGTYIRKNKTALASLDALKFCVKIVKVKPSKERI